MAYVRIEEDETYDWVISPIKGEPRRWEHPVLIPDDILAAYEAAVENERRIRRFIIETYCPEKGA